MSESNDHILGPAWEPVGSHGMNYRRKCRVCMEIFVVSAPDEEVLGECPVLARARATPPSDEPLEPVESSPAPPPGPPLGRGPWPAGTVRLTIQRVDGLSVDRILDGSLLSRARYPDDTLRATFSKMLTEFMEMARQTGGTEEVTKW